MFAILDVDTDPDKIFFKFIVIDAALDGQVACLSVDPSI